MNIYLEPEEISLALNQANLTDEVHQEHEIIAKASADNAARVIIEWLEGDCPHVSHTRARHWCGECYQALEELIKEEK